jgi:hypothetical protein
MLQKNVDAIRRLFGALNSRVGNLPDIFPDDPAQMARNACRLRQAVIPFGPTGVIATRRITVSDLTTS